jgi:hypothetical protein
MEIAPSLRSAGGVEVVRERKNKGTGKVHLENERRRRSLALWFARCRRRAAYLLSRRSLALALAAPLLHSTAKNAGATVPRAAPLAALSHDNFVTAQGSRVIQNEHIRSLMILLLYASITMPRLGQKPGNSGRGARENEPCALGADGRFWRAAPRGDTAAKCAGDADSPERRLPTIGVAFGFRAEFRPWCDLVCGARALFFFGFCL